ncbi:MAG: hypothetical protein ABI361_06185 [Nitrososphaera sp.]
MRKSDNCLQNNHGTCEGIVRWTAQDDTMTAMCSCECHNSMYQLIKNTVAVANQNQRNNPYAFTHDGEL